MFGIDDAIIAAVIGGGASLAGGMATNAANMDINSNNLNFNAMAMHDQQQFNRAEADKGRWFASDQQEDSQRFAYEAQGRQQDFAYQAQENAQAFSAQQAAQSREFTNWMAGTGYQRAANDLQAAGLNRVLALGSPATGQSFGAPTGSPMGAGMASPGTASSGIGTSGAASAGPMIQMDNILGRGVGSAMDLYRTVINAKNLEASTEKTEADAEVSRANAHFVRASTEKTVADTLISRGVPAEQAARIARDQSAVEANLGSADASHSAAGASREEAGRLKRINQHYDRYRSTPGASQGYSGFSVSIPPPHQITSSAPSTAAQSGGHSPIVDMITRGIEYLRSR